MNQSKNSQKIVFISIIFALIPDAFNLIFNSVLNRKFCHEFKSIIFCNDYNQISKNSEPWDLVTFYNVTKRRLSSVSGKSFMMKEINSNFSLGTQRNSVSTIANQTTVACSCLSNLDQHRNLITSSQISNSSKESRPSLTISTLNLPHSINNVCSPSKINLQNSNLNSKTKPNCNKKMTKNSKKTQPQVKTEQRIQTLYRKKSVTFCSEKSIQNSIDGELKFNKILLKKDLA